MTFNRDLDEETKETQNSINVKKNKNLQVFIGDCPMLS